MSENLNALAPIIFGCSGLSLTEAERDFFTAAKPAGFILFARNCAAPDQTRRLVEELCQLYDEPVLILIDQEGGKVERLKPPHWESQPPARFYGDLYQRDPQAARRAVHEGAHAIARALNALGIHVNCMPVLDVPIAGADDVIGSRAYSEDPHIVADLGAAAIAGLKAGGVLPVIKHLPGHGRAKTDSHHHLPVVEAPRAALAASDFLPFAALSGEAIGMTAHILFSDLDDMRPATLSPRIINDIMRGAIGFQGLLLSDDIGMNALKPPSDTPLGVSFGAPRSASGAPLGTPKGAPKGAPEGGSAALAAGCDIVLHCSGDLDEMRQIAHSLPALSPAAELRLASALSQSDYLGARAS